MAPAPKKAPSLLALSATAAIASDRGDESQRTKHQNAHNAAQQPRFDSLLKPGRQLNVDEASGAADPQEIGYQRGDAATQPNRGELCLAMIAKPTVPEPASAKFRTAITSISQRSATLAFTDSSPSAMDCIMP
jgi:hypothetical protein